MYSSGVGLVGRAARVAGGRRGVATAAGETQRACVRSYSVSGKRAPVAAAAGAASRQQDGMGPQGGGARQGAGAGLGENGRRNRVPKFTMAQADFAAAALFARHRQLVGPAEAGRAAMDVGRAPRPSFKTLSEVMMCKGQGADEANVPHAKLRQIYAAPASAYMRVTPDAMIPEAMRLGPLAEPLLGRDPFSDGLGALNLGRGDDESAEFVEEFFDALLDNARNAGKWSVRRERRARQQSRWLANELVDPVDGINAYQMTSVRRKRKTKMNKHKHRKLRKKTRALRKRLGK
ncbi:hypothetical protein H4R18_003762 [Coemansia javaensis]|uniref:Small ribosomal subunit protein mS38 n=1 Tax=Coemansia javaensis TaxID=2761396 RepID=A0A9W8HB97_9FUNG|nr:hypothetical protein H4R18_003762 [Coemansia javaensis]